MEYYKYLTFFLVVVIVWEMVVLGMRGRSLAREFNPGVLAGHRALVACIGCLTVLTVALIEMQVRMSPAPYQSGPLLLGFHLVVVAALVLVFAAIVLRFTGLRNPLWHRRLAYAVFALFALAMASGGVMLYRLPVA